MLLLDVIINILTVLVKLLKSFII